MNKLQNLVIPEENITDGNFLEWEKDLNFDVIVGNPPYQSDDGGSSIKLWKKFIIKSSEHVKPNGMIALVTPISWSKPTRGIAKGDDQKMLDIMYNNTITHFDMNVNDHFKGVGVNIGYWIMHADVKKSDIPFYPVDKIHGDILYKMTSLGDNKLKLKKYIDTVWTRGIVRKDSKEGDYIIPCVEKSNKLSYVREDEEYRKVKKIHVPRNFGYDFFPDDGECGFGYQAEVIELKDNDSLDNAMAYMTSKLMKFVLSYKPWIPQPDYALLSMLPAVDFTKHWKEEELYDLFELTPEEREYVENNG